MHECSINSHSKDIPVMNEGGNEELTMTCVEETFVFCTLVPFLTPKPAGKPSLHFYGIYIVCMILLLYGLLVYDAWKCFFLSPHLDRVQLKCRNRGQVPSQCLALWVGTVSPSSLGGSASWCVMGRNCIQLQGKCHGTDHLKVCVRVSYALTHAITVSGFTLVTVSLPTSTADA